MRLVSLGKEAQKNSFSLSPCDRAEKSYEDMGEGNHQQTRKKTLTRN